LGEIYEDKRKNRIIELLNTVESQNGIGYKGIAAYQKDIDKFTNSSTSLESFIDSLKMG
jgi:hypothetical protein